MNNRFRLETALPASAPRSLRRGALAIVLSAFLAAFLSSCALLALPDPETSAVDVPPPAAVGSTLRVASVDETAMLPLLAYLQRLQRMSASELVRERNVLAATAPSAEAQLRTAAVLGQVRGPIDLARAIALLDGVLKSSQPAALSLHPLARFMASNYLERLRLQMHNEKLAQQLNDGLLHNAELQEKLDALTAIERSLPVRPTGGENNPASPR